MPEQPNPLESNAEDSDLDLTDILFTNLGLPKLTGRELVSRLLQTEIFIVLKKAGILTESDINEMLNRVSVQIADADDYMKNSSGVDNERHQSDIKTLKTAAIDYIEQLRQTLIDDPVRKK